MVVHYPRSVWKNSCAEHKVTGKTYNLKKLSRDKCLKVNVLEGKYPGGMCSVTV